MLVHRMAKDLLEKHKVSLQVSINLEPTLENSCFKLSYAIKQVMNLTEYLCVCVSVCTRVRARVLVRVCVWYIFLAIKAVTGSAG